MMKKRSSKKADNMIYSPDLHIPLGQAVRINNGEYGLRVKKDKTTFEVVPLGKLMSQIVQVADTTQ